MNQRLVVVCKVTERCNLGCSFCGYDRALPWPRASADPEQVRALGQRLAAWRARTGRAVLVSWLGGEPLLWPPLLALAREFKHALGLGTSVTTNGTTLGSARARATVREVFDEITVSVDGVGERHDRVRGWEGGFAFLQRAMTSLARERGAGGPLLRVNTIVMRDNVDELPTLCRALADWGVDEITWNQLGGNDRPAFFPDHRLRPEDVAHLRAIVPGLRAELAARGVILRGTEAYLDRTDASAAGRRLPVADCAPGEGFVFASLQGRLAPCSFTADELGVPATELHDLPAAFRSARLRIPPRACEDCPSTQVFGKFQETP